MWLQIAGGGLWQGDGTGLSVEKKTESSEVKLEKRTFWLRSVLEVRSVDGEWDL
jgi:hypothetical protein